MRLCLGLLLSVVFAAQADDVGRARELFQQGKAALDAGRSAEALAALQAAYAARAAPSLIFYIGEAELQAGHRREALADYQRYLAQLPAGPMREQAADRIAALQPASAPRKRTLSLEPLELEPEAHARPAHRGRSASKRKPPEAPTASPELQAALPLPTEAAAPSAAAPSAQPVAVSPPVRVAPADLPAADAPPEDSEAQRPAGARALASADRAPPAAAGPRAQHGQRNFSLAKESGSANVVSYRARLLVPSGASMGAYATTTGPGRGALYTHGLSVAHQGDRFRNGVYAGFGTEAGGPGETLQRYELSWQCIWSALGADAPVSPYLGLRLGGMLVKSALLTGGAAKPGAVLAAMGGVEVRFGHFALDAGLGYDENLGASLSRSTASVSGYSFDLGASFRF